jgi:phosphoenolpyruvate carboxykinase (GTP)
LILEFFSRFKEIISINFSFCSRSYLATTDPLDVARVESKTVICTQNKRETIPTPKEGVQGLLGNWISPSDLDKAVSDRFPGCMKGQPLS